MTKTITQDDVLRYIYKETSDEETLAIEKQLLVTGRGGKRSTRRTIEKVMLLLWWSAIGMEKHEP